MGIKLSSAPATGLAADCYGTSAILLRRLRGHCLIATPPFGLRVSMRSELIRLARTSRPAGLHNDLKTRIDQAHADHQQNRARQLMEQHRVQPAIEPDTRIGAKHGDRRKQKAR